MMREPSAEDGAASSTDLVGGSGAMAARRLRSFRLDGLGADGDQHLARPMAPFVNQPWLDQHLTRRPASGSGASSSADQRLAPVPPVEDRGSRPALARGMDWVMAGLGDGIAGPRPPPTVNSFRQARPIPRYMLQLMRPPRRQDAYPPVVEVSTETPQGPLTEAPASAEPQPTDATNGDDALAGEESMEESTMRIDEPRSSREEPDRRDRI